MRNSLQMQIFIVGHLFLWSRLVFNISPLGSPTSRGEFETKPGRNLENQGASFPLGKQKQSFSHPGPFHEKRNNHVVLFPRFLVHFGAPGKQFLKSPCFVSSYFPCFNFFPTRVHPGNNPWKVRVSFLPIFRVSTSSLVPIAGRVLPATTGCRHCQTAKEIAQGVWRAS